MRTDILSFSVGARVRGACSIAACVLTWCVVSQSDGTEPVVQSTWEQKAVKVGAARETATIAVEVSDSRNPARLLPVRVIVTASDGSHPDGAGRGVYSDGRFFADGQFQVAASPGATRITISSGPIYVPLEISLDAKAAHEHRISARLTQWFSPEALGWYAGDNHVHVKHDAEHKTRTSRAYTILQGRANGLTYLTEAGSSLLPDDEAAPDSETFIMGHAQELRPGPFVGHRNTPGITKPLLEAQYRELIRKPLPTLALLDPIHRLGGAVILTHPLSPPHLLHWMGSTEAWSHAVLGRTGDAFDIDSRATEALWFAMLNLGCRVAASGSTDAALERTNTPSPGDRRVYSKSAQPTYEGIVDGIRAGRTFMTNGGPVFPFLSAGKSLPGDTLEPGSPALGEILLKVHTLHPLAKAELYWRGDRVAVFPGEGKSGEATFRKDLREVAKRDGWFVLRAEDTKGNWAITSPIYVRSPEPSPRPPAHALILAIGNHTRFIELRPQFFAHCIVTTSEPLTRVELLRDGQVLRAFEPKEGNQLADGKLPVSAPGGGEYAPGWIWHEDPGAPTHFQADWPVNESGSYALRAHTATRVLTSTAIRFSTETKVSHAIGVAKLEGGDTRLELQGYGEEMPLAEIRLPFKGDRWWYPTNSFWRMNAAFGARLHALHGMANPAVEALFQR
jgi:hypothetical protein